MSHRVSLKLAEVIKGQTDLAFLKSATADRIAALNELARVIGLISEPPVSGSTPCEVSFDFSPGMSYSSRDLVLTMLVEEGFAVSGNPAWELSAFSWAVDPPS